jgi:hypothetical protein
LGVLPDRIWGWEMPVLGEFTTLNQARSWARRILPEDVRAEKIHIRESVAVDPVMHGYGWEPRHYIETITRES